MTSGGAVRSPTPPSLDVSFLSSSLLPNTNATSANISFSNAAATVLPDEQQLLSASLLAGHYDTHDAAAALPSHVCLLHDDVRRSLERLQTLFDAFLNSDVLTSSTAPSHNIIATTDVLTSSRAVAERDDQDAAARLRFWEHALRTDLQGLHTALWRLFQEAQRSASASVHS